MDRKRRLIIAIALITVMLVSLAAPVYAAKSTDQLKNDLKNTQKQVKDAKNEYSDAKAAENALNQKIQKLIDGIRHQESDLAALQKKISANNYKIINEKVKIDKLEGEVGSQKSSLNSRLRAMYMMGDTSVLEVLLGSKNIVDFIQNLDMIKRIHAQDVSTVEDLNRKLAEVEKRKADLEKVKAQLKADSLDEQAIMNKLESDKSALDVQLEKAHKETVSAWNTVARLQAASDAIQRELQYRQSSTTYGGGKLAWPVHGIITSEFGYRTDPISGRRALHAGIDIAVPTGTPVHAAADGEVIFAGWNSGGYGYFVMIDNGSNIVTCYAHNSAVKCHEGQKVKRGDVIALAGSTGASTGPHCHFEVRVNGAPQNPRIWL